MKQKPPKGGFCFMVRPNGVSLNLLDDHEVMNTMVEWGAILNNLQLNQPSSAESFFEEHEALALLQLEYG
ncbi:MAG: hypothetical protein HGA87_06840 [Desulfobulbaceae bacterium]|nr:hypothetical protein [Desulfobulbaceae bacterium]